MHVSIVEELRRENFKCLFGFLSRSWLSFPIAFVVSPLIVGVLLAFGGFVGGLSLVWDIRCIRRMRNWKILVGILVGILLGAGT